MASTLSRYRIIIKQWAWLVIVGVLMCSGITFAISQLLPPVYQATATIIISVGAASNSPYESANASITLMPTYTELITNTKVLEPVAAAHRITVRQLMDMMKVSPQSNTQLIELSVENENAHLAAQMANEVAQSFAQFTNAQLGGTVQIQILAAVPPIEPIRPKPLQDTLIGALVGLALAISLITVFEWLGDRLKEPEEVQALIGADPLASIPMLSQKQRTKNVEETPALAEGCRILCARLTMLQRTYPFKTLMITSVASEEGKSTVAANIATFLAMSGKRVLLVDADLRHPVLDRHFQLSNQVGLSTILRKQRSLEQGEIEGQTTDIPSLRVLTAGAVAANPPELLQSSLAHQLFNHFRNIQKFDYVIFDTPPLIPVADAQILATYIQATVLVIDATKTPRKMLRQARTILSRAGTHVLGAVINKGPWTDQGTHQQHLATIPQDTHTDITSSPVPHASVIQNAMNAANTGVIHSAANNK